MDWKINIIVSSPANDPYRFSVIPTVLPEEILKVDSMLYLEMQRTQNGQS